MDGLLKKLAATAGAAFSINQIVNYADSYTGMVNKLKLVTSTQSELSRAMDDTHKIAQATASDWNGVLDVYTKFQGLSKRLGIDQAEVARITETVTKTVSMSGQSAAASEAALLQFGQALNTGLLRGAELTSVLSQAPALAKAIAQGMGVAIGDLKKLGEEGKITSEKMRDALLKMSGSVDAEYAKTATTVAASFNLIKNEAVKMIGEFDATSGASEKFVNGMKALSQNMDIVTNTAMIAGAYMAGTYIPIIIKGTQATISDTVAKITNALAARSKAIADFDVAKSNLAATAAMVRAMGVTNAQTAAMMANARAAYQQAAAAKSAALANTGLMGILGGPVGIGVTLAAVAAGVEIRY
jgi:tape measure domain-containing protein